MEVIRFENVVKRFGGETVLDNLLFDGSSTLIIACNWNNVTVGFVEAINNAHYALFRLSQNMTARANGF